MSVSICPLQVYCGVRRGPEVTSYTFDMSAPNVAQMSQHIWHLAPLLCPPVAELKQPFSPWINIISTGQKRPIHNC